LSKNVIKLAKSWQKVSKLYICPSPDIWLKILKRSEEEEEEDEGEEGEEEEEGDL
jgi:hypothetical protein